MTIKNFVFGENWVDSKVTVMKTTFFAIFDTAVLAGNDHFWKKNITQDRKRFISTYDILIK